MVLKEQQGLTGIKGEKGEIGSQGTDGTQGTDGNFGGATFDYTFDATSATPGDPGTGKVRLNSLSGAAAGQKGATAMYIDDTDDDGTDIQSFMQSH